MKIITLAIAAAAILTACTSSQPKMLVLYYSQEGATQKVAEEIAARTGADIERFDVENPYSGTYDETIQRCLKERTEGTTQKALPIKADLSKYDVIFLGYPIWFGTYAPPVKALLQDVDLSGKTVVPFCTFGSGGLSNSIADLFDAIPDADIREGYGVRTARVAKMPAEVERFLILGGYIEGTVEEYPDYSQPAPVTEEQAAVFDAACSSYQFNLGTPVSVGVRETSTSTDYLFDVENTAPDGSVSLSKIFVTTGKEEGSVPEFTMVMR